MGEWTLFSNHGHVLVCLARNQRARLRDVASDVGITERAVQKIVSELQQAGLIAITKHGRCNQYEIHGKKSLRHPLEAGCTVGRLLQLVVKSPGEGSAEPTIGHATAKPARKHKPAAPRARSGADRPPPTQATESKKPTQPATERAQDGFENKSEVKPADQTATKTAANSADKAGNKSSGTPEEETRKQGSLF